MEDIPTLLKFSSLLVTTMFSIILFTALLLFTVLSLTKVSAASPGQAEVISGQTGGFILLFGMPVLMHCRSLLVGICRGIFKSP